MKDKDFHKIILGLLPFGIDIVDEEGNILFLGPNLKERLGKDSIGKKCWRIYKDDKKQCKNCPLKNGVSPGETKTIEVDEILGNKTFIVHHTGIIYNGKKAALEIFEDITGLKKVENDLKKFQLAVNNASDHIIITDKNAKIIYANKAVERITGYELREVMGDNPSLWGGQMSKDFYQNLWKTIEEEKRPFTGDIINRRKNGEKYFAQIKISPILNEEGEVEFFTGIERDVTQEKEIEKSKSEFVSLASHELRTPLASISLASEMLISGIAGEVTKEQKKYLKNIYEGVREMAEIIEFLLNVSRIEMGMLLINPESLDVPKFINIICKELRFQMQEKKIKLKKIFDKNIPEIEVDKKLIRLIVENLISNAIKYNKDSGQIVVKAQKLHQDILLNISDAGYGIPKDQHDKIFTKFFRANNYGVAKAKGTGLGLYIVKKAVEELGGKIWFESKENKGTTFSLSLPIVGVKKIPDLPEHDSKGFLNK